MDASEETPMPIGIVLKGVPPMTPEGSPATILTDGDEATSSSWARSYDLKSLLDSFDPHANGYRIQVNVSLDGTLAGSSKYWVGCDQAQTGNPTRMLFAVEWLGHDGVLFTEGARPTTVCPWVAVGLRADRHQQEG